MNIQLGAYRHPWPKPYKEEESRQFEDWSQKREAGVYARLSSRKICEVKDLFLRSDPVPSNQNPLHNFIEQRQSRFLQTKGIDYPRLGVAHAKLDAMSDSMSYGSDPSRIIEATIASPKIEVKTEKKSTKRRRSVKSENSPLKSRKKSKPQENSPSLLPQVVMGKEDTSASLTAFLQRLSVPVHSQVSPASIPTLDPSVHRNMTPQMLHQIPLLSTASVVSAEPLQDLLSPSLEIRASTGSSHSSKDSFNIEAQRKCLFVFVSSHCIVQALLQDGN